MLDTSKDILNIIIATSVGIFAIFTCYAIFYFAQILRQGFKIIKEMRDRMHKVDSLIKNIEDKVKHSTSHIVLIAEGVKKLVEVIKERTGKNEKKNKKQNKSDD